MNVVMKMLAPDLNYGFAWDPATSALYITHGNGKPHEQIASVVMSPQDAETLAAMWCQGYRSRKREEQRVPGSRHYHMLAEMGAVGAKLSPGG